MIEQTDLLWFSAGAITSMTYILWDMGRTLRRLVPTNKEDLE